VKREIFSDEERPGTSSGGGLVLIVEDEPEIAESLEYCLNRAGFDTLIAQDGMAACRMIGERRPHLILLDILLPLLDGWEVCRLVRSHPDPQDASVPIIMLTALSAPQEKFRGLELGADAYLPKPFSMREVVLLAQRMVDRRRAQLSVKRELEDLRSTEALRSDSQGALFHELKNQLLIIAGYAELLAKDRSEESLGQNHDSVKVIRRSASYLSSLADDFLLLRQVESGLLSLPLERLDLAAVLKEVILLHHGSARARKITLTLRKSPLARIRSNAAACRIVFSNLIDNAIKYSRMGGTIRIGVLQAETALHVEVADSGPGIPEDEQEHIFERFYRSSRQKGISTGTGLGLYAARALIEAVGGSLVLAHSGAQGSLFRVELPL